MTARFRSRLFWIFVACFLVAAPLIMLWSQGYRFDLRARTIVRVGGLLIRTTPTDANVAIEGFARQFVPSPIAEGYVMQNLLPGTYQVTVTKEGYFPWSSALEVEALHVRRADAILFLRTPSIEPLATPPPAVPPQATPYRLDAAGNLSYTPPGGEPVRIGGGILAFSPAPDGSRLTLVTRDQILSVLFLKEVSDDIVYPAQTTLKVGLVEGKPLNIFWLKDGWHVLLRFADRLHIIDIESPGNRYSYPIAATNAVFDRESNTLTYRAQNAYWRWKIE